MTNAFGIYVHVPYCNHRCSYCDFYSVTGFQGADFPRLLQGWVREVEEAARWFQRKDGALPEVGSVFFGGGTPSLCPPPVLGAFLKRVRELFPFAAQAEVTLEANPETVVDGLPTAWLQEGFNRVSLGAQSFQPHLLRALDRRATPEQVRGAIARVRGEGFANFNLDLIFGIPGQSREDLARDLEHLTDLRTTHVSFYNLTLTQGHPLYGELPEGDEVAAQYEVGLALFAERGFERYEISNFARPGYECRHNQLYWTGGDYLGVGPSAASRLFREGNFWHRKQVADTALYLAKPKGMVFEPNSGFQTALEASFLEFRTREGVDPDQFERRYGFALAQSPKLHQFLEDGFLERRGPRIRLTSKGYLLADRITSDLVG